MVNIYAINTVESVMIIKLSRKLMNLLQEKKWLINIFAVITLTVGSLYTAYYTPQLTNYEKTPFLSLSNADIDNILAVKAKMQAARIQTSLSF